MRFIGADELRAMVPMRDAIVAVKEAFIEASQGKCDQPLRTGLRDSRLLQMAASVDGGVGSVVKVVTVTHGNRARGLPTVQAVVIWFDGETGSPQFVLDGNAVTALRTGAASGAATELLAPPDASVMAMIGSGGQALDQIQAVLRVRPIAEIRLTAQSYASSALLANNLRMLLGEDVKISIARGNDEAIEGADVICCATNASAPVFNGELVGSPVHINAIGAFKPTMCELPPDLLARAHVIAVDQIQAAMAEAGDLIQALTSKHITRQRLVELGSLLRDGDYERERGVTIFKSVGIAVQDWAIANLVNSRVRRGDLSPEPRIDQPPSTFTSAGPCK